MKNEYCSFSIGSLHISSCLPDHPCFGMNLEAWRKFHAECMQELRFLINRSLGLPGKWEGVLPCE